MGAVDAENQLIAEAVRRIRRVRADVVRVLLFGSRARGTGLADSDMDLVVIVAAHPAGRSRSADLHLALRGLGVGFDLIVLTLQEWERLRRMPGTVGPEVAAEGRLLHEAPAT